MIESKIREILRGTLIPIPLNCWDEVTTITITILNSHNIQSDDQPKFLEIIVDEWSESGTLDPILAEIIVSSITQTDPEIGERLANNYFEIHNYLIQQSFISPKSARIALSHLRLIYHCATSEKMSSAKIVTILRSIDSRLEFLRWQDLQVILRRLGTGPTFGVADMESVYNEDMESAEYHFADATMYEACEMVGNVGKSLHFSGNLTDYLWRLISGTDVHKPYLQILHYQCMISAFYDHNLTNAYEFAPRGVAALWLFEKWNLPTGNPILNNAKAVDNLDESWANAKKQQEYPTAKVLTDIFSRMDQMGFAASNELAGWLRKWLVRYLELNKTEVIPILTTFDQNVAQRLLASISTSPTNTYGILEQRLLDVIGAVIHSKENWIPRGLGDSVNANNLSKTKLGDSDFQDSSAKTIVAYEAHGGRLTDVYYQGHIKTLKRSMEKRALELEKINPLDSWSVKLKFIAFDFASRQKIERIFIQSVSVEIEFYTFQEILATLQLDENFQQIFKTYFVDPINKRNTPQFVRDKVLSLLN